MNTEPNFGIAEDEQKVLEQPGPEGRQKVGEFLIKDYELKVRYLSDHFSRMWVRFNFFLTLESALIGGKIFIGDGKLSPALAGLGAILSLVWYVFGAQDRYLVRIYRKHVEDAGEKVTRVAWPDDLGGYRHVGEIDETVEELRREDAGKSFRIRGIRRLSGWRFHKEVGPTSLAALFPLLVFFAWLAILVTQLV